MSQKPLDNILTASHLNSAIIWYEQQIEERQKQDHPYDDLQERAISAKVQLNTLLEGL